MAAPLSKWLPQVLPQLQDCPAISAERAILMAAIQFCQRTNVVQFDDYFNCNSTEHSYHLDTLPGTTVQRIERIAFDGVTLDAVKMRDLDRDYPAWRESAVSGVPQGYAQVEPDNIILLPIKAGRVDFRVSLTPLPTASTLPDVLATHFFYGIAAGAVAQLKSMAGNSWYDPAGVAFQQQQFEAAVTEGMRFVNNGQGRSTHRTRAQFF